MNYDDWKSGYYESDYKTSDEYVKLSEIPDLQEVREDIRYIMNYLYRDDDIDIAALDNRLSSLAEAFGLSIPDTMPNIMRAE